MKNFSLPVGWRYVSLLDLVDVIGGVAYNPNDITNKGIRIVRGGNIQDNIVKLKDDDVYLPLSYKNENNSLYRGDIVLVASTGSVEALGRTATVWEDMKDVQIGAFLRILRPKQKQYAAFISAWLSSEHYLKYIKQVAKGTSINNIGQTHLQGFKIPIPLESEIDSISHVYSSLSNKIALNRAINRNLEALAKQLYDYWFVQFDFPDENGRPYKSSGGKMVWDEALKREVPEGWICKTINEIESCIITGKTPPTADEMNYGGTIPFITIDDIRQSLFVYSTERTLSKKGADSQMKKYLPKGSLCCSCIGTVGIIGFVGKKSQTNQQINSIIFHEDFHREFLFFSLKMYFQYANAKTGNILSNMNKEEFSAIKMMYPSINLLKSFHNFVMPLFQQIDSNIIELQCLTKQRDELLPLLMNGQVTIEN